MLYPQSNPYRQHIDLSGFWDFQFDPGDEGAHIGWGEGFTGGQPIAVPASWNDQFATGRDYLGVAWYQTHFSRPWGWGEKRVYLRFNSVNYLAEVWLNGVRLGEHEGGHLPFIFDVTDQIRDDNQLVVRVDGSLAPDHVPPGNLNAAPGETFNRRDFPDANFDFFPFCGIQRPVLLYATAPDAIQDITVITDIQGTTGLVYVEVDAPADARITGRLTGHGVDLHAAYHEGMLEFTVPDAALWQPGAPNLYDLTVELERDSVVYDRYTLSIGIRTFTVEGDRLLLNGQPIMLRGFGRHEDFPVTGRGYLPAVIVKDYALMHWVGANSFRTTHYPYSEQMMDLADQLGFLVIAETPAVGLFFSQNGLEHRAEVCRQQMRELIARDKNHPSVVMWSLANEPHSGGQPAAKPFFRDLYDLAKSLDGSRPVTVVSYVGEHEEAFEFCDVVCLNRYFGWYSESGEIDRGVARLSAELDALHSKYPKPLILSEFGADTIPGWHALEPEMFSEEYQADMLAAYLRLLESKPYVAGAHVWNLCDFKTAQGVIRMGGMNYKGVFTRDRRPKLAAHKLRALWNGSGE